MFGGDAALGLPDDLPDGRHALFVDDVYNPGDAAGGRRTVRGRLLVAGTDGPATDVLLAATALPDPVVGEVYDLVVEDGAVADATVDAGRTTRRSARRLPDDAFVVPLHRSEAAAGTSTRYPNVVSLARNHSVLVLGEPGAGKTEFIKLLLPQLDPNDDDPVVVFDFKGEYREWAERRGDVIRLSVRDATHHWNAFAEIEDEAEFEEIGRVLFKEARERENEVFWPDAARSVLVASMKYLYRESERSGLQVDNHELSAFFSRFDRNDIYGLIAEYDRDEDLRGALSNISPDVDRQATSVMSHLQTVLRDVLVGDFARRGTFSIREYMADPRGRTLLLDYPIQEGERVTAPFRFFVNWAIRFGLDDPTRNAYFVLDEFAQLPHADYIKTLVATGRSRKCQAILGLQSLAQLESAYDTATARSILSGLTQEVFLRSGDPRTVEYVVGRLGGERRVSRRTDENETQYEETLSAAVQRLDTGEGYVLSEGDHLRTRVPMWTDIDPETRTLLRTRVDAPEGALPATPS